MKSPLVTRLSSLVVAALAASAASAAEWFVSPTGNNSNDGTEASPFRTINYAIGQASANDTITLFPGDYDYDTLQTTTVNGNSSASRVKVTKKLTIRSKDGRASRDTTRIVGAWDTTEIADTPYGIGPNAVRCVWIAADAAGTRLEGITFLKGSVPAYASSNDYTAGGGVFVNSSSSATFVDCAFIDCQAWNGGAIVFAQTANDNVKAVRCLFKRCRAAKFGHAMRGGAAYNCVFDDCGFTCLKDGTEKNDGSAYNGGTFTYGKYAINCTFLNGRSYGIGGTSGGDFTGVYNCLFQNHYSSAEYNSTYCPNVGNCVKGDAIYTRPEVYSPYDGDYRLTSNAKAINAGSAEYLAYIPEEFRTTDYYGNPRTTDGNVSAGAVQEAATALASGIAIPCYDEDSSSSKRLAGEWTLDGEPVAVCYRTWAASEGWPVPRHVRLTPPAGRALVRFIVGGDTLWPLPDDSAWVASAKAGQVQTIKVENSSNIFYADPVNGDDTTGDGSEANPYKTLNKAVHKTTASFVVRAKAGDYNEGGENNGDGIITRVVVPNTLAGRLRVVAEDGPENTFITGTSDSTSNGTGANAVRCIAVASTNAYQAAFQDFTIRDGRTGPNGTVKSMGAALSNIDLNSSTFDSFDTGVLLDCVITNCSGNRAAAIAGGNAYRCRFYDCKTFNAGGQCLLRYCSIVSSLFVGCGGQSQLFGNTAKGYNCTIYGSVGDVPQSIYNNNGTKGYLYNCVSGRPSGTDIGKEPTDDQLVNTLYCRMSTENPNTFTTAVKEEPLKLMDAAAGDYRLTSDSAGLYLASTDYLKSCMDIDGKPFVFRDGRYQAGCYAIGKGTIYVDAVNGNDANDGSSEADAFQTLAAAMVAADYGDTVVALPGTYDSGTMLQTLAQSGGSVEPTLPSRVVVKSGVTLASRDGAAATIIQGAASTDAGATSGCGEGAVRGVFLCRNATLRGFTVTDGHTLYGSTSSMTVNDYGGGVGGYFGTTATTEEFSALVEDCILDGNVACRGGGAMFGTFRNCLFTGNTLAMDKPGWAVARAHLEGCLFSGNGVTGKHSSIYGCDVVNCTILGGQAGNSGVICNENNYQNTRAVLNTIVTAGKIKANVCTNCLFGSGVSNIYENPRTSGIVVADANLDANGIPLAGSPAIDAGNNALASAALLASRDPAGTRRVLNSTIDIGAYEYDWGVPWGAAIGNRRLVIDDMPSDATLSGNALVFGGSAVPVLMTWDSGSNEAAYEFTAQVTGAGTLVVTANGDPVATLTAADGARTLSFNSELATNALVFAYDGAEPDGVTLYAFSHQAPTVLMVR